jgi:hypothetical protein
LSNLTAPAGGQVLRTPFGTGIVQPPAIRQVVAARAKFTTFPNQTNDPGILLCTPYAADGTTLGATEFPVIGMEPHNLNDDLLIWQPPGGAMGKEQNNHRSYSYSAAPQDLNYSVDGKKIVWQEFTDRKAVIMQTNSAPSATSTKYPYACYWWHILPSAGGTAGREGFYFDCGETDYGNLGPFASSSWLDVKEFGTPGPQVGVWTGEYDPDAAVSGVPVPRPIFATGTKRIFDSNAGSGRPAFTGQTWKFGEVNQNVGTAGSPLTPVGGAPTVTVNIPGGGIATLSFDWEGKLVQLSR